MGIWNEFPVDTIKCQTVKSRFQKQDCGIAAVIRDKGEVLPDVFTVNVKLVGTKSDKNNKHLPEKSQREPLQAKLAELSTNSVNYTILEI